MKFEHIAMLSKIRGACDVFDSVAKFFPPESAPSRSLHALSGLSYAIERASRHGLDRLKRDWYAASSATICASIRHYGELASVGFEKRFRDEEHCELWRVGPYSVLIEVSGEETFWTEVPTEDVVREVFRHVLADLGPESRVVLRSEGFERDPDLAPAGVTSEIAALIDRLRLELERGPRSVLLHGPPGAGKTSAARQIVEQLAPTALVIGPDMLSRFFKEDSLDVFDLVCTWRPGAVVLDDMDRGPEESSGWMVAGLSRIRSVVPLVVATVNARTSLSGAVLRPGRFDRVLRMERLDESIVRTVLVDLPADVVDEAIRAGLLGSYADELALRFACGGDPAADLSELLERQFEAGDGLRPIADE